MTDAAVNPLKAGLEDVVVSPSEICFIDGRKGRLIYRGYDVDDLVAHSTFEEVTFLLWQGRLPSRKELDAHLKALASTANRKLPPKLIAMLKALPKNTTPMEVIRTAAAAQADVHSAVVAGICALKGPLHGGANEQVMLMVEKIKDPAKADAWIHKALTDKARIMGFGHRVYRVEDPRAKHLKRLALELGHQVGDTSKVQILDTVVRVMGAEKHIFPNVDLYSGAAYAAMGMPTGHSTPRFAMSQAPGWPAHVLEQHGNNRLIRPRSDYTGAIDLKYVPLADR